MKTRLSSVLAAVVGVGVAAVSVSAHASWSWTLNTSSASAGAPSGATVTGYTATSNSAALTSVATSTSSTTSDKPNYMTWFTGGYGICSPDDPVSSTTGKCTSPNHAMDNKGSKESMLLDFGSSRVNLSSITIGWPGSTSSYDSDISVLAYTGSGTPIATGGSYSGLLSNGWQLINNYANVATSAGKTVSLGTTVAASQWLIAAYNTFSANTQFNSNGTQANCTESGSTMCMGNDYVKLYSVAGNTVSEQSGGKVSEPSALLLFGTALFGLFGLGLRRRAVA